MNVRALLWVLVASLALVLAVTPALAASPVEQYREGKALFLKGEFAEALPLFRKSLKASKSPNARLYVARCLEQLGHLPEAYDQMQKTVRVATSRAEKEPKYAATRDASAAELALLEPQIGKLIITVAGADEDVEVSLDGEPLESARLGVPVTVTPGGHDLEATAPDHDTVERHIEVKGGSTLPVTLAFGDAAGEGGQGTGSQSGDADEGIGGVRVAGIVVAGVGVAGMVVFAITGAMVSSNESTLADECGGRCSDPRYDEVIDEGKTLQLVANVSLAVGGAALLAGGAMILFGGPDSEQGEAAPSATLRLGPGSLTLDGRF